MEISRRPAISSSSLVSSSSLEEVGWIGGEWEIKLKRDEEYVLSQLSWEEDCEDGENYDETNKIEDIPSTTEVLLRNKDKLGINEWARAYVLLSDDAYGNIKEDYQSNEPFEPENNRILQTSTKQARCWFIL